MPDSIVSVRMPSSLLDELRQVADEQHYMDLSEAVRSLIRKKVAEKRVQDQSTKELINGLQNIITQLENGAKQEQ